MANALLSPKVYSNTFLKLLKNNVILPKMVTTEFKDDFKKVGSTVYAKRVPEFTVRDGAVAAVQDVVEGEIAVTIDKQKGVDVEFTSVEDTLTLDSLMKSKAMNAAAVALAQQVDGDLHALTKKFYSWVGTPGQVINSYADLTKGPQRLDEMAVETSNRVGLLHPEDAWALLGSLSGLTAQQGVATDALTRAKLPMLGNIDWYSTQNASSVTTGTRSGNALIDGANQDVAYSEVKDGNWVQELVLDAVGNATTVKAGEVFTIANVFAINPRSKTRLSYLQQFTVIDDETANSTASGQVTLTISPPIITSGAFQTVACAGTSSTAPDDDAAIQWMGSDTEADTDATTYNFGTIFRKEAIALVSAKLTMPFNGEASYSTDPDTGLSVRYWRSSDPVNDTHMHRFDILYGVKMIDPRRGTRISGTAS
jgi:hypothetical protein